jgi:hypothetical protein
MGEYQVKTKLEIGIMWLHAKECQRLPANHRAREKKEIDSSQP